jgi:8-oxo-dGTP diphosphatase
MDNPRLLAEISDGNYKLKYWHARAAARGILMRNGKVALLNVKSKNFHKLPGGGIEDRETKEEAFIREIKEETGHESKVIDYAGIIIEYRKKYKLVQLSYIFAAESVGIPGSQTLEADEIAEGHELEWYGIKEALRLLESERPEDYEGKFILKRDIAVLKHYSEKFN